MTTEEKYQALVRQTIKDHERTIAVFEQCSRVAQFGMRCIYMLWFIAFCVITLNLEYYLVTKY